MVNLVVKTALLCLAFHDGEKIKERERESLFTAKALSAYSLQITKKTTVTRNVSK